MYIKMSGIAGVTTATLSYGSDPGGKYDSAIEEVSGFWRKKIWGNQNFLPSYKSFVFNNISVLKT